MFKHILIPTDASDLSAKAVKAGIALAKTLGAKVSGLHVYPATFAVYYGELAWADDRQLTSMREAAREEGKKYLDHIQSAAKSAGVSCEPILLEKDSPWQGIIETAERKGCDLIVMAAHGRRGISAVVLGSETNKVLTHSTTPVLVYR